LIGILAMYFYLMRKDKKPIWVLILFGVLFRADCAILMIVWGLPSVPPSVGKLGRYVPGLAARSAHQHEKCFGLSPSSIPLHITSPVFN